MAELVGAALLSGLINVLFERMASKEIVEFFQGKKAIPKLLEELEIRLISANVLLNDAEDRQLRDQNVKNWLEKLKDVIDKADRVFDKINTEALRRENEEGGQSKCTAVTKCFTCFPVRSCLLDRDAKVDLEEILASLKLLLEQSDHLGLKKDIKRSSTIPKLQKDLEIMLNSANALLNDAEEKQLRDQNVKNWLEELKDLMYDVDHVVDKINTEVLRCEIEEAGQSESMTTTKCSFDRAVKEELEKILASLKFLLDQSDHLGLNKDIKRSSTVARSLAPLVEESDVCGRDDEKNSLIKLLLSDDVSQSKISVIPIVGMGGIGKTTLAQVVFNDARVQEHFDFKVWVTVSEEFDVPRLTKVIFESITSGKCEIEDPHGIQSELYKALRGKKFLFVHDDVWNEEYKLWDLLKSAFQSGAHGSKIIVTTRSDIVAKQMGNVEPYRLGGISEDDCWALFRKHVFGNVDEHSDWKEIGIQFVKKCKGLPLAVKSIAGLLRSVMSREAWREILESDIWEFREFNSTNILPPLWLSYSFLPPSLKRCFALLSVFPKDYRFHDSAQEKIILMWMAEGLLQPQDNRRAEDVGKEYLNVLVSRSFFQHSTGYHYANEPVLIMHDLIHDLALFVSSGQRGISSKTRYFSFKETSEGSCKQLDTTFLRTLIVKSHLSESIVLRELVLSRAGCLRALSLFKSSVKELPHSIGTLKPLRYLDLSETRIEELPDSLCSLYNLQTLLLTNCRKLRCLPTDLSRLIKLRHLNIEGVSLLKEMPPQMCNMKHLQALSSYVFGENQSSKIKDLGELRLLRGSLCLRRLHNVITVEDALGANMKNKKYLDEIRFEWGDVITEDPEKETEVLSALEPHSRIKEVEIKGFRGTKLPNWLGEQPFKDIVKASLIDCRNCCSLPPFGELASLRILTIKGLNEVVSIGDEFRGTTTKPFPCLESLDIKKMCSWEKWSFSGFVALFPRLKDLTIRDCDKLKCGLPNCSTLPALKSVYVDNCKILESFSSSGMGLPSTLPALESVFVWDCPQLILNRLSWGLHRLSSLRILSLKGDIEKRVSVRRGQILESFSYSRVGLPSSLQNLYVWNFPRLILKRLSWGLHRLPSLRRLSLDNDIEGDSFPEEGLLPTGLQELSIFGFESLKALNDKCFQNLTTLQELDIYDCEQLQHLPAEGLPQSLNKLEITRCPLLNNQCQRETGHYWPKIQHIPQIIIDFKTI